VQASGAPANNKFEIGRLQGSPLQATVIEALGSLATDHRGDLLLSVPTGGDWLVQATSRATGIPYKTLSKSEDRSFLALPAAAQAIAESRRIIVVDDILNMLTNSRKVLEITGVEERSVAAIGVIDRGPRDRPELDIPTQAVLRMPVDPLLHERDSLWQYVAAEVV
jgi:hypothetical protein